MEVIKPEYYKRNGIEAFDIIDAFELDFYLGNALKYLLRAGKKSGSKEQDLLKCHTYIMQALIEIEHQKNDLKSLASIENQ